MRPQTAAGRALLEREAYNSRSFALITEDAILAIERDAVAAFLASPEAAERLARAIRTAETRSQMEAQQAGEVPPEDGPLPDWYRAYAADVAREYAALSDTILPGEPE